MQKKMLSKYSEYEIKVICIVIEVKMPEQVLTKNFSWEYNETEIDE